MSDNIIVAIITGLCTAVPAILTCIVQNNGTRRVMEEKIAQLEKKVEYHNGVVRRMEIVEDHVNDIRSKAKELESQCDQIPVMQEKIAVANHRIEDLEKA